jgi:hypothetical protein
MNNIELQNNIIKNVLFINDSNFLSKINSYVKEYISSNKKELLKIDDIEEDISNFKTFEDWNMYIQTVKKTNPNEVIPEFNITNSELLKLIWDSEHSETITYEEFVEDIKTW